MLCCQASLLQVCPSQLAELLKHHHLHLKEATCPVLMPCCPSFLILVLGCQLLPQALAAHPCPEICAFYGCQPAMLVPALFLHLVPLDWAASWLFADLWPIVFPQQAVPIYLGAPRFPHLQEPPRFAELRLIFFCARCSRSLKLQPALSSWGLYLIETF